MKRITFIALLIILLQGCAAMDVIDAINPFSEKPSVELNAQVGKNNTQNQTDNKSLIASNDKVDVTNTTTSDNQANVVNQTANTSADKSTISTESTSTTTNDNKADVINQDTSSITNYPTPVWLILAFAAMTGIAIPNPFNHFSDRRKRKERKEGKELLLSEIGYLRGQLNGNNKEGIELVEGKMASSSEFHPDMDSSISDTGKSDWYFEPRRSTDKPRVTV